MPNRWLNKNKASSVLRELGACERALAHATLDELPVSKPIERLRAILIATNQLPPRGQHLVRVERWITSAITGHPQAQVLHRYAIWHLLRRLRARNNNRPATQAKPAPCSNRSGPPSHCWTGSTPTTSPSRAPDKVIWTLG